MGQGGGGEGRLFDGVQQSKTERKKAIKDSVQKLKHRKFHTNTRKNFTVRGTEHWKWVAQRGCGVSSFSGDIQDPL